NGHNAPASASRILAERAAVHPGAGADANRRRLYELLQAADLRLLGVAGTADRVGLRGERMAERNRSPGTDATDRNAGAALAGVPDRDESDAAAECAARFQRAGDRPRDLHADG